MEISNCAKSTVYGILFLTVECVLGRDVCQEHGSGVYTYCDDGYYCCDNNTRCCYDSISPGLVIGIVLAALFVIAIIGVAIYVLVSKKKTRPNRVVMPVQSVTVGTIRQSNSYQYFQTPPQPPAYSQTDQTGYMPPVQPGGDYRFPQSTGDKPPPYSQTYTSNIPPPPSYRP